MRIMGKGKHGKRMIRGKRTAGENTPTGPKTSEGKEREKCRTYTT